MNCNDNQEANVSSEYKRQLCSALCGHEEEKLSMLGFGGAQEPSSVSSIETSFGQPDIHSSNVCTFSNPTVKKPCVGYRTVETEPCESLCLTKELRG
jgi:hypothetical protein